jgi:hypothetical protein
MSDLKKRLEQAEKQAAKEQPSNTDEAGLLKEGATKVDKDGTTDTPNVNDGRTTQQAIQEQGNQSQTGLKNSLTVGTNPAVKDNSDNGETSAENPDGTTGVGAGNDVLTPATAETATAQDHVVSHREPMADDADKVVEGINRGVAEGVDREVAASNEPNKSPFVEKPLADAAIRGTNNGLGDSVEGLGAYVPTPGSFKAIRLPVFVTRKGLRIKPNAYGYYVKEELDNEQLELLRYYRDKGLVEEVLSA